MEQHHRKSAWFCLLIPLSFLYISYWHCSIPFFIWDRWIPIVFYVFLFLFFCITGCSASFLVGFLFNIKKDPVTQYISRSLIFHACSKCDPILREYTLIFLPKMNCSCSIVGSIRVVPKNLPFYFHRRTIVCLQLFTFFKKYGEHLLCLTSSLQMILGFIGLLSGKGSIKEQHFQFFTFGNYMFY